MKKGIKLLLAVVAILALGTTYFYFWASSSNYPKNEYAKLIRTNFSTDNDQDSTYKIISYNIGYLSGMTNNLPVTKSKQLFDDNLTKIKSELQHVDADLLCLQEVDYNAKRSYYVNQLDELQNLGFNYAFQAVNWDLNYLPFPYFPISAHHGKIFSGQSILSKYPLADNERLVLDKVESSPFYRKAFYLDRLIQVSKVNLDGRAVILFNVHLEAFDQATRRKHTETVKRLYNEYKDKMPVLLTGDFNCDLDFDRAAIKMIMDIPDIGVACLGADNKKKTFPSDNPKERLDYIFYNKKFIELVEANVLTSFGDISDHLPVFMKFKLKNTI